MRAKPLTCLLALVLCATALLAAEPALTLKPNDLWVMAGDSITAQRLHTNFIEAFFRTRFPGLNLQFRNSGIGGNQTSHILARFDYDVAAFKPTIVSIELGMNDVGGGDDPARYIKGQRDLLAEIRGIGATPVLISSSPVNDGSLPDAWKADRCRRLHPYTEALVKLAAEENVVCVDQYHPLLTLWGKNKAAEKPIDLTGDAVHPGMVGQYTMAATILAGLKVDGLVSSASLQADGKVVEAKRCALSEISAADGKLAFTRRDEASPWPLDPKCGPALELMPAIADLTRYELKVAGLAAGRWRVSLNGQPARTCSEQELAAGVNLGAATSGYFAVRATKIIGLIAQLQSKANFAFRGASKAKLADKMAEGQKQIDELEAALKDACKPEPVRFEVVKE